MKDIIIVALLVSAFAFVLTTHVAIAYGLLKRRPRWRAPVALVLPPLAPYWAWKEHMRVRTFLWIGGIIVYVAALIAASHET